MNNAFMRKNGGEKSKHHQNQGDLWRKRITKVCSAKKCIHIFLLQSAWTLFPIILEQIPTLAAVPSRWFLHPQWIPIHMQLLCRWILLLPWCRRLQVLCRVFTLCPRHQVIPLLLPILFQFTVLHPCQGVNLEYPHIRPFPYPFRIVRQLLYPVPNPIRTWSLLLLICPWTPQRQLQLLQTRLLLLWLRIPSLFPLNPFLPLPQRQFQSLLHILVQCKLLALLQQYTIPVQMSLLKIIRSSVSSAPLAIETSCIALNAIDGQSKWMCERGMASSVSSVLWRVVAF